MLNLAVEQTQEKRQSREFILSVTLFQCDQSEHLSLNHGPLDFGLQSISHRSLDPFLLQVARLIFISIFTRSAKRKLKGQALFELGLQLVCEPLGLDRADK